MPVIRPDRHAAVDSAPVIRLSGATVGYDGRPAVTDVDVEVQRGETTVLLGPNGAGKSTLVRAILGLERLMSGSLELFGVPGDRFRQRHRLGYVPQRHTVGGGVPCTVGEVVMSGRLPLRRPFQPASASDRAAVREALVAVELADHARAGVATLSGGQQRRVLIARALAADPDVLVMDEPTAGVDAATQRLLAQTLARLSRSGRTLLLVAHELGPLRPLIDRVLVLRDGRLIYDGRPVPDDETWARYDEHDPTAHDHHHLYTYQGDAPGLSAPAWPAADRAGEGEPEGSR